MDDVALARPPTTDLVEQGWIIDCADIFTCIWCDFRHHVGSDLNGTQVRKHSEWEMDTMTDYAACAKRIIQAYNDKDFDALKAAIAPDIRMAHFNRGASFDRADDLIAVMRAFGDSLMPDRQFEPAEGLHVCGNIVVREGYWGGTAMDDLAGFGAKGETLRFRLCSVMTFSDEGILVDWKDHG